MSRRGRRRLLALLIAAALGAGIGALGYPWWVVLLVGAIPGAILW